jgi:hypothetical protein
MKKTTLLFLLLLPFQALFSLTKADASLLATAEKLAESLEKNPSNISMSSKLVDEMGRLCSEINTGSASYAAKAEYINNYLRTNIGTNIFERIESAAVQLYSSDILNERIMAIEILAQVLRSKVVEASWESMLTNTVNSIETKGDVYLDRVEFFSLTEGLAYLGNTNSISVLRKLMEAEEQPWIIKQLAFEALADSMFDEVSSDLLKYIQSDDRVLAYNAISHVGNVVETNNVMAAAAAAQFVKATDAYLENGIMDMHLGSLVQSLNLPLSRAFKNGILSADAIKSVKNNLINILLRNDEHLYSRVVSMFGRFADDSDAEMFPILLKSDDKKTLESACFGLSKCSPALIRKHEDRLLELLGHEDKRFVMAVLLALRKGLGENVTIETLGQNWSEISSDIERVEKAYGSIK